jgi:hypothetical protein
LGCAGSTARTEDDLGADDHVATDVRLGAETSIFGGARDDDNQSISSVVALKVGIHGAFELCSAALIAPNVLLTARHCVAKTLTTSVACDENGRSANGAHIAGDRDPSELAVYVGASPSFREKPDAIGMAVVGPSTDELCDSDIALVVLDRMIASVKPLSVRLHAGVTPKERVRSVGYGQNDNRVPVGTRLRKDGVEILAMGRGVSPSRTALGAHEFEVGRSICQGDSGGPAIDEDTGAVVGVVSRGGQCDDDFGHIYTTTAGWSALFDRAFAIAGGTPTVEPGAGTNPEPRSQAQRSDVDDPPRTASSCSSTGRPAQGGASLALTLACALVLKARSRRNGLDRR